MTATTDDLTAAGDALRAGDVPSAVQLLRSYLADRADPEARLQLTQLLFLEVAVPVGSDAHGFGELREHLTRAVQEFTEAGLARRAALAASRLGFLYGSPMANRVAARPWFARAWRLIENEGPCLERGWVAIAELGCNVDDPAQLLEHAHIALDIARQFGDTTLEAKALADGGLALVELGDVQQGMDRIDEAMALVTTGAVHDYLICGLTTCSLFTACAAANDLGRMQAWSEVLRTIDLVGERGIPILTAHCSTVYGHLLCTVGRWNEAESVLVSALEMSRDMHHAGRIHTATALAELRILQGRLDEAEHLILGYDDYIEALVPLARLYLARGDFDLAAGTARRGLRLMGSDQLRAASLFSVLVEASLGLGDTQVAADAAEEYEQRVASSELVTLRAEARFARARVLAATGDTGGAVGELDQALRTLGEFDAPLTRARLHIELARLHATIDRAAAISDARAAAAIHARLEAPIPVHALAVLSELGIGNSSADDAGPERTTVRLSRDGGWWTFTSGTDTFHLRDTKGLRYLAELIAHPSVERHVFDLVALTDPVDAEGAAIRRGLGDAGAALDAKAKAAYRRRIEELRERVDDAQALENDDEAAHLEAEIDMIVADLARAVGLGGRERRMSSGAEKARLNVTRAIRAAVARIAQADARAGGALDRCIHTGIFCSYQPHADGYTLWSTA